MVLDKNNILLLCLELQLINLHITVYSSNIVFTRILRQNGEMILFYQRIHYNAMKGQNQTACFTCGDFTSTL